MYTKKEHKVDMAIRTMIIITLLQSVTLNCNRRKRDALTYNKKGKSTCDADALFNLIIMLITLRVDAV